jgi:hypothetical protein
MQRVIALSPGLLKALEGDGLADAFPKHHMLELVHITNVTLSI